MTRRSVVLVIAPLALVAAACSPSAPEGDAAASVITVAAAASLADVFKTVGEGFTRSSGIEVNFSFAGSSAIAEQIRGGAPIDAFASAGATVMEPLVAEQLVSDVSGFATNSLAIAVPPGNPGQVTGIADLERVSVVVCQEQVPCGVATAKLLELNALTVSPVSFEPDVRSVLGKVTADEVDAGIVYVTDVIGRPDVASVAIAPEDNVTTDYQAAVVVATPHAEAARAFIAYLTGPEAQAALAAAGFEPPP